MLLQARIPSEQDGNGALPAERLQRGTPMALLCRQQQIRGYGFGYQRYSCFRSGAQEPVHRSKR